MNKFEEIARQSESTEAALVALHEFGATAIEAIKAIKNGRGISHADCKIKLIESPAWKVEAAAAANLHKDIDKLSDSFDDK